MCVFVCVSVYVCESECVCVCVCVGNVNCHYINYYFNTWYHFRITFWWPGQCNVY